MYRTIISADALRPHIYDANWRVVDCRFSLSDTAVGRQVYAQGHIPGAVYAHLDEDLSSPIIPGQTGRHPLPDPELLAEKLGQWGIDAHVQVVAYDDKTGMVASRLWWLLRQLGHERVAVLDGGYAAWLAMPNAPVSTEVPVPTPRTFRIGQAIGAVADAEAVEQIRQSSEYVLVDSREPYRYKGEAEPIDPVAGHIPGAVNAFYMDNLDEHGRFLPKELLRARFRQISGAGRPAERVVFYCGSGVSACHNVLAMAHAGLGDATLYAGSWSEWIADGRRAVGRG